MLGVHKRKAHGIEGTSSHRNKRRGDKDKNKNKRRGDKNKNKDEVYQATVTVVLEAAYPNGIPTGEIERVVRWMEETRGMLGV